jgi:SAM-dependent methyltransferase
MSDSRQRFSSRVDAYLRYRPDYPESLVPTLLAQCDLEAMAVAADIGSGTGIFSKRLLQCGLEVYAVEPNPPMRAAAERLLGANTRFHSIDASAENTGLASQSIDLLSAAQAFHWFNNDRTRSEFARILKPGGHLALVWNRRDTSDPFQQVYEHLLREFAPEYGKVNHMNIEREDIATWFATGTPRELHFNNAQQLDFAGLLGRLKSASYCPAEDSPLYIPLVNELLAQFERHARDGLIEFNYDTQVYLGEIAR